MSKEMKCPFCGEKLYKSNDCHVCFNANCIFANNYLFDEKWWAITKLKQALIQSQRDLAKAIDALDTVRQHKRGTAVIVPNDIAAYCDRVIDQITHDKGGDNE